MEHMTTVLLTIAVLFCFGLRGGYCQLFQQQGNIQYDVSKVDDTCRLGHWKAPFTLKLHEHNLLKFFQPVVDVWAKGKKVCQINVDPSACGQSPQNGMDEGCHCVSYVNSKYDLKVNQEARAEQSESMVSVCIPLRYSWFRFSKLWCFELGRIPRISGHVTTTTAAAVTTTTMNPVTTTAAAETTPTATVTTTTMNPVFLAAKCVEDALGKDKVCQVGKDGENCTIDSSSKNFVDAAKEGYVNRMCVIIGEEGDALKADKGSGIPLELAMKAAIKASKIDSVHILIGYDVTLVNNSDTFVGLAQRGPVEMLTLFIDKGADTRMTNKFGNALHNAIDYFNTETFKALLDADDGLKDIQDAGLGTPLHRLIMYYNQRDTNERIMERIDFLLNKDPNLNIRDNSNRTPLEYSKYLKHTAITQKIEAKLAQANQSK